MHYLYSIYSITEDIYYIGETIDTKKRLTKHNNHSYKGSFTKIASDWKFSLTKELSDKEDAIYLENFIKRMKSKIFIKKVINNPKILDDILSKRKS